MQERDWKRLTVERGDMANKSSERLDEDRLYLDDEELDAIRALLVSILMKDTRLDKEEIYVYVFGEGKKILWH
jgi:hypothetical protein